VADSHLVWRVKFAPGLGRSIHAYEDNRDLLETVTNKWSGEIISEYRYSNDALGRREWVYREGTAFAGDHADVWGYNARNELTGSQRYNTFDPNDPNSPSDPNHAFDRAYVTGQVKSDR
jgi:hypothetical protein